MNTENDIKTCSTCGSEIRGEICGKCYTDDDQGFESYTPTQNFGRYIFLFLTAGLLALAYVGTCDNCGNYGDFIQRGTRFFVLAAIYGLYMSVIYGLAAVSMITKEQARRLDPLGRYVSSFVKRK